MLILSGQLILNACIKIVTGDGYLTEKVVPSDNSFRRMLFESETGGDVCELRELSEPDYIDELVQLTWCDVKPL